MSLIDEMCKSLSERTNTEFWIERMKREDGFSVSRYKIHTRTTRDSMSYSMCFGPYRINDAKRSLAMLDDLLFRQGLQIIPRQGKLPTEGSVGVE